MFWGLYYFISMQRPILCSTIYSASINRMERDETAKLNELLISFSQG